MDRMFFYKRQIRKRRKVERTIEVELSHQLLWCHGAKLVERAVEILLVPGGQLGHGFRLVLVTGLHAEFAFGDFLRKLYVDPRNVPCTLPRGTSFGIGPVISLVFRNCADNFLGGL